MRRGLLLAFLSLLAVGAATAQEPTVGAAVNEASGEPLLSPGVLAAIFGQNLTEGCMDSAPPGAPWPTMLCNMQGDIVKCCGWARSGGVLLNHQSILENLSL